MIKPFFSTKFGHIYHGDCRKIVCDLLFPEFDQYHIIMLVENITVSGLYEE